MADFQLRKHGDFGQEPWRFDHLTDIGDSRSNHQIMTCSVKEWGRNDGVPALRTQG